MMWVLLERERRLEDKTFSRAAVSTCAASFVNPDRCPKPKPASELLMELRARHVRHGHGCGEFGSILGLVTKEDLLEQLVR